MCHWDDDVGLQVSFEVAFVSTINSEDSSETSPVYLNLAIDCLFMVSFDHIFFEFRYNNVSLQSEDRCSYSVQHVILYD